MLFIFENLVPVLKYLPKLLLYGFFFFFFSVAAQDPHPAFRQYDVEHGLSSSRVYQVKQDSKGYMWFATDNGVNRFNGYEFEQFPVSGGLTDNTVFEIFEDTKGRIWFLTLTNKLFYFERDRMHLYKYNHVIDQIPGSHVKTSFCVAENGSVFLGLSGYGIIEVTAKGELKKHAQVDPSKPGITVMEPVPDCLVYLYNNISSDTNTVKFDTRFLKGTQRTFTGAFNLHPSTRFVRLKNKKILFPRDSVLYIITDTVSVSKTEHFNGRINWIYEDKDNDLWIGTYMGGVYHIENGDFKHKKNYLKDLFITGVAEDSQGGFWFTTEGNSVYYTPSKKILTYDEASGLKDARITCLTSDSEGIYMGLQRPIIQKILRSGKIESYDCRFGYKAITSLYYDYEKQELWFSWNIASGFMNKHKEIKVFKNAFIKMVKEKSGSYWFVNSEGIYSFLNEKKINKFFPEIKRLNAILTKDKETLLLGTINGLWEYRIADSAYRHLYPDNLLLHNRILDMMYGKDGTLFIGTKSAGLLILNKNGSVRQINHMNGLSSDNVAKVLVDGATVWLATDKGLNRLVKNKDDSWKIKVYTTRDGLISNEVYDLHQFDHKIWVATDKGLSFFDPAMPVCDPQKLSLSIKQVTVNDSGRLINNQYHLAYFENNIKIRFIALSYKDPGKLKYRYKMEGLNSQWNYTRDREIQYTTLPPGNYTFIVSVLNDNGEWNGETSLKFTIATPFWKTWWFLIASVILLIAVLYWGINYWITYKHREKNKNEEINRLLLSLKLKALRAQMNPHFIFNVMNSIQHFVLYKNNEAAHRYLSKFSRLIRTILNNSDQNMILLSEEIKALELYLDLEAMRFEKRFDYEIRVDGNLDPDKTEIPSMLIQPYVENAIKHGILSSSRKGMIKIEISREHLFLKCIVEDNGIGRQKSAKTDALEEYRSFGTSITKERLSVINELYGNAIFEQVTDLYDENREPAGTRIEIYIPYHHKTD